MPDRAICPDRQVITQGSAIVRSAGLRRARAGRDAASCQVCLGSQHRPGKRLDHSEDIALSIVCVDGVADTGDSLPFTNNFAS